MNKYRNIFILALIVAVLFGVSRLPLAEYLDHMTSWFRGFGIWAPVIYFVFYTVTQSILFPVFLLSIAAGILFGVYKGVLIVSLGNLAHCTIMFLIARYKGREWFEKKLEKYKSIKGFTRAIESEGWKMLFMLRIVPIVHMIVLNISCGLSKVRTKDYMLGTWLGMLPLLVLYVYMGSLTDSVINSSSKELPFSGNQNTIFIGILIALAVVFLAYMKKVMKKYVVSATA